MDSVRQRRVRGARDAAKTVRGQLDLRADFAGAHADGIKQLGRLIDEGGIGLFHAHRAAAAVDVAGVG